MSRTMQTAYASGDKFSRSSVLPTSLDGVKSCQGIENEETLNTSDAMPLQASFVAHMKHIGVDGWPDLQKGVCNQRHLRVTIL